MSNTTQETPLARLLREAERANEIALRELGIGLIDVNVIAAARCELHVPDAGKDVSIWGKPRYDAAVLRAADRIQQPEDPDPSEVQEVIACLGDDAAALRGKNPEDEMAANMERAADLLDVCAEASELRQFAHDVELALEPYGGAGSHIERIAALVRASTHFGPLRARTFVTCGPEGDAFVVRAGFASIEHAQQAQQFIVDAGHATRTAVPGWFDIVALDLARLFTDDDVPQDRARLQVAVIEAMRMAANPQVVDGGQR
ncbi:MAG: hypothetical protein WAQ08_21660 [Aquabacterium sp.]|uniref:hypothetical protein n=1 Tax=Aquabacterium sp. TaxID=1872578 RepID=UPI003BAEDEFA